MVETGGVPQKGKSGELYSVLQYLPTTWQNYSRQVLGYVAPVNAANEKYVAAHIVQQHLDEGLTEKQIVAMWNAGHHTQCKKGTNKHGVPYDCPGYVAKVLAKL